jgi:hypothetical protein
MSALHFALASLGTMCYIVWANITITDQHPYYWVSVFSSPFIIMIGLVLITKTINLCFKPFIK